MDWTPDGRMVLAEKPGVVKVLLPNGTVKTVLDISNHVNTYSDRGLTGIAVDAQFASNGYVYLLYTYDAMDKDDATPKSTRLTRIVLKADSTVATPKLPETVILGTYPTLKSCPEGNNIDCIPADGISHVGGSVRAAPDGTLYVGTGDAMFTAQNSPNPMRPLDQNSMAGKILHIDRNGRGLPGHPFCPQDNILTNACTRIHAMGFRNPFRFGFATRGGVWVGDVGENLWEELDHVPAGGSFGWPCYEGAVRNRAVESNPVCQSTYTAGKQAPPNWSYSHTGSGACIIGGPEIRSARFPTDWQGDVFAGDIVSGELKRLEFDSLGKFVGAYPFAAGWFGADLRLGPDGYLYSANFGNITRFVPVTGNRVPQARATVTPSAGLAPFDAHFDGTTSSDPDGDVLTYLWTFGDGLSSTLAAPTHTYATNGRYTARLTVTDPSGATSSIDVPVVVGTTPPSVAFTQPAAGFLFTDGVPVNAVVSATDAEDGTLPNESIQWQVVLQHNQHQHLLGTFTGPTAQFTPLTTHDADSYYLMQVTATDSYGVSTTVTRRLDPRTVNLELATDPPLPADLFYDGAPHPAPFSKRSVVGFQTTIVAPDSIKDSTGKTLVFGGWSDGGAANHQITIPGSDVRLVARYVEDSTPPETTITSGPGGLNKNHTPTFTFTSSEAGGRFECRIDTGAWVKCASPYTTPFLKVGSYTFYVRAYDVAGNVDPTPAEKDFSVLPGGG